MGMAYNPSHKIDSNLGCFAKTKGVMSALGYSDRSAFWSFVRRYGVPHTRFNARVIRYERSALNAWLAARSVG